MIESKIISETTKDPKWNKSSINENGSNIMLDPLSTNGSISPTVQEFILNSDKNNVTEESDTKFGVYSPAPPLSLRP